MRYIAAQVWGVLFQKNTSCAVRRASVLLAHHAIVYVLRLGWETPNVLCEPNPLSLPPLAQFCFRRPRARSGL